MESLLISPKDQEELQYLLELMATMDVKAKQVSEKDRDDFELAQLLKDVDSTGIVREQANAIKLTGKQKELLRISEQEIIGKTIVSEKQIQVDEDEWLSK